MEDKERYHDRDTFSYQLSLEAPSYLPPIPLVGEKKLSWAFYLILEFTLSMLFFWKVLFFFSVYWAFIFSALIAWNFADPVADLKIDGKFFHRYLFDKIMYWLIYGRRKNTHYLSQGNLIKKIRS